MEFPYQKDPLMWFDYEMSAVGKLDGTTWTKNPMCLRGMLFDGSRREKQYKFRWAIILKDFL